jgi:hypothetical protein
MGVLAAMYLHPRKMSPFDAAYKYGLNPLFMSHLAHPFERFQMSWLKAAFWGMNWDCAQLRHPVLSKFGGQQKSIVDPLALYIKQNVPDAFVARSTA